MIEKYKKKELESTKESYTSKVITVQVQYYYTISQILPGTRHCTVYCIPTNKNVNDVDVYYINTWLQQLYLFNTTTTPPRTVVVVVVNIKK